MWNAGAQVRSSRPGLETDPNDEAGRPVDLVHLSRQTMGNKELESEVLRLYAHQVEICVEQMADARDARAWLEAAHAIKGSARGVGAWQVADAAERAEKWTFDPAGDDRGHHIDAVSRSVADANRFIESILS